MSDEPDRICPRCPDDIGAQSVDNFGRCEARPGGRNLYCKKCIREKVAAGRSLRRAMKMNQQAARDERAARNPQSEPLPVARPIKPKPSPADLVFDAIKQGHCTQRAIRQYTGIRTDIISEAIRTLMLDHQSVSYQYNPTLQQSIYFVGDTAPTVEAAAPRCPVELWKGL